MISTENLTGKVKEDMTVKVKGVVHRYVDFQAKDQFNFEELRKNYGLDLDRRAVIVANVIANEKGQKLIESKGVKKAAGKGAKADSTGIVSGRNAENIEAGTIAKDPQTYMGRAVRVRSEVATVYSPNFFTIDKDQVLAGPDILVLMAGPSASYNNRGALTVKKGMQVTITGIVQPFINTEVESNVRDLFKNSDPGWDAEFEKRPLIIATSVRAGDQGVELVLPQNKQ